MATAKYFCSTRGSDIPPQDCCKARLQYLLPLYCDYEATCCSADVGSWVRVRGGLYKGDLAKLADVDYAAQRVTLLLVPRLDYAEMARRREEGRQPGQPFGRQGAIKPQAKYAAQPLYPWRVRSFFKSLSPPYNPLCETLSRIVLRPLAEAGIPSLCTWLGDLCS